MHSQSEEVPDLLRAEGSRAILKTGSSIGHNLNDECILGIINCALRRSHCAVRRITFVGGPSGEFVWKIVQRQPVCVCVVAGTVSISAALLRHMLHDEAH